MRVLLLAAACLLALYALAPTASATRDPIGGCGADSIVEVCAPVCVQGPCYPYVCVNTNPDPVCVRP